MTSGICEPAGAGDGFDPSGRRRRWVVLGFFALLWLACYVDVFVVGALLAPIKHDLDLSDEQLGRLNTIYILAFVLVVPAAGFLGDWLPRKWFLLVSVAVVGAATVGSGTSSSFIALLSWRALAGVGEGVFTNLSPSWIADLFEARLRGPAFAVLQSTGQFAAWIAYAVGGAVAAGFGWRYAYWAAGLPVVALSLGVALLKEPARGATKTAPRRAVARPTSGEIGDLFRQADYLLYLGGYVFRMVAIGGLFYWGAQLLGRRYGLPNSEAVGFMGSAYLLAGTPGILLSGLLAGRFARKAKVGFATWLIAGEFLAGVSILTALLGDFDLWAVEALLLAQTFFAGLSWGAITPLLFEIAPVRLRNLALSFAMIAQNLGAALLGAELIGAFSDLFGIARALLVVPAGYFIGASFWLALAFLQSRAGAKERASAAAIAASDSAVHL